jgi:DNA-3-methyladenine glycosylase I
LQAGLRWLTILRKRENDRRAFDGFDPKIMPSRSEVATQRLLGDAGIVRNRVKVESTVRNARSVLAIIDEAGSLDAFLSPDGQVSRRSMSSG